jgi:hypothetical protein
MATVTLTDHTETSGIGIELHNTNVYIETDPFDPFIVLRSQNGHETILCRECWRHVSLQYIARCETILSARILDVAQRHGQDRWHKAHCENCGEVHEYNI